MKISLRNTIITTNRMSDTQLCPYCKGTQVTKKGTRQKKLETVQLYFCNHCNKKFTLGITKGKTYPLKVIFDTLTQYNRLNTLEESSKKVGEKYGLEISVKTVSNWIKEYSEYTTIARMRDFINKKCSAREAIEETRLFHGQIYDFKYHRAKMDCVLNEEYRHSKFKTLQEFLELVIAECPHQIFKETHMRASDCKGLFNLDHVKIAHKENAAVKTARLVMQAVDNNKLRHETLQEFMLVNDSVTVATEVPVLLDYEDIAHYTDRLGFMVPVELADGEVLTGHIDIVQIRNGSIHILDYKPSAKKEKPVDQLTIYALALSRLTGIRLYHFKCGWFDEEDYFEFYPLHVVYKKKKKTRGAKTPTS